MKTAGIILIAASILLAGRDYEKKKRQSARELERFLRLLSYLEQEITYRQTPLSAALRGFAAYSEGLCGIFAERLQKGIGQNQKPIRQIWEDAAAVYERQGLTAEEMARIRQAGAAFSLPRREMIASQTKIDQECLWELLKQRRGKLEQDCRLLRCLSVMGSLFAVILLM